jgi:hypothetical protein
MTDCSLVGSHQPPFEQGDHKVNPWHQLRRSLFLSLEKRDLVLVTLMLSKGRYPSQPSVWMTVPGSTESCTKGTKLAAEASTIWRMRIRPIPGRSIVPMYRIMSDL